MLYSKDGKTLVYYPISKGSEYTVPSNVTDIDILYSSFYDGTISVDYEYAADGYITVDGVTYTKDMKRIIACDTSKEGDYVMPNSVENISSGAFSNSSLSSVKVSYNVTDIVYNAFSYSDISEITLPDGLVSIGDSAFAGCQSLTEITLPSGVLEIGENAFSQSGLTEIILNDELEKLSDGAFAYCSDLVNIEFNDKLVYIGAWAFAGTAATSVEIPGNVKYIGDYAFDQCTIESLTLGEGIETIGDSAFYMSLQDTELVLPNSLVELGNYAFAYSLIQSLTIGSNLKTIPAYCFSSCWLLTEVTIPSTVKKVCNRAFAYCDLRDVTYSSATTFDGFVFEGNRSLPLELYYKGVSEINIWNSAATLVYYSPTALTYNVEIPDGITDVVYGTYRWDYDILNISLPSTLISLGADNFENTLWYENQPDGEVYLDNVFIGIKRTSDTPFVCGKLKIAEGTRVIANCAFQDDDTLDTVILPDSLISIGSYAFLNSSISSIYISENVQYIGTAAFAGCDNLKYIDVDEDNPYYTSVNGVLYSKDKSVLICCPYYSGCFVIDSSVKKVCSFAFDSSDTTAYLVMSKFNTVFEEYSLGYDFIGNAETDYYTYNYENAEVKWNDVIVLCKDGSTAQDYALANCMRSIKLELGTSDTVVDCSQCILGGYYDDTLDVNNDNKVNILDLVHIKKEMVQ